MKLNIPNFFMKNYDYHKLGKQLSHFFIFLNNVKITR